MAGHCACCLVPPCAGWWPEGVGKHVEGRRRRSRLATRRVGSVVFGIRTRLGPTSPTAPQPNGRMAWCLPSPVRAGVCWSQRVHCGCLWLCPCPFLVCQGLDWAVCGSARVRRRRKRRDWLKRRALGDVAESALARRDGELSRRCRSCCCGLSRLLRSHS